MDKIKKSVILIFGLIMISVLSFAASAAYNLTVTIKDVNDTDSVTYNDVQYIKNGTYNFNFTFTNDGTMNISIINITLPLGFAYQPRTNGTSAAHAAFVFNVTSFDPLVAQQLIWNATDVTKPLLNATGGTGVTAWFAFKTNVSLESDGLKNFTITYFGNCSATINGSCITESYILSGNISVDNTPPTLSSALTKTSTTVNVTFSELINISATNSASANTFGVSSFGVFVYNGSAWITNIVTSFAPDDNTSSTVLLTVTDAYPINFSNWINVTVNGTTLNGTVKDRAGNLMVVGVATSQATALDGIAPDVVNVSYDYYTKQLLILFNEPINGTSLDLTLGINISDNVTDSKRNLLLTGLLLNSTSVNYTTLTLTDTQRNTISGWRVRGPSPNINTSVGGGIIKDMAGNSVNYAKVNTRHINDTTLPNITLASWKYEHAQTNLTLVFNETVDVSGIAVAAIYLHNASNISNGYTRNMSLTGATVDTRTNSTIVYINLTSALQRNISSWVNGNTNAALYLSIVINTTVRDLAGNNLNTIENTSALKIPSYTKDSVAPTVLMVTLYKNASVLDTGLQKLTTPVKAGNLTFNVSFSEAMDPRTAVTLTYAQGSTTATVPCAWANDTAVNCSFGVATTATNGWYTISISDAKDVSQINTMTANNSVQFSIDTVAPKVIRAYYIENDFRNAVTNFSAASGAEYIVLDFNENVSLAGALGTAATPADAANFTRDVVVLNVSGNAVNLTNMTVDNSTHGYYRIKLQLNDSQDTSPPTTLTIRGVYNPARLVAGDPSGIDVKSNQPLIVDNAGNGAQPNTSAVDIADRVISFEQNVSKVVSVPYCVNASLTDEVLTGITWACSSYTTAAWSNAISSTSSMIPLEGFKCTITGQDLQFYIYTSNSSMCNLNTVSLNQNWNLVSVDGGSRANATVWFTGLGSGSEVSQWYTDIEPHTALKSSSATVAYINETANPYTAYWIFTEFGTTTKNWAGRGFY